jgi:calcineurin-like phosphoesterase family protein
MKDIQKDIIDKLTPEIIEDMQHVHFTADLHFSHDKIIDICKRPVDVEYHNEWLLKEVYNKHVGKKDEVYILGDLSFAKKADAEKILDRMNGNKFLIEGNHDKNIHIVLCHYKMVSWNRKIHGSWMLHGHDHCRESIDVGLTFDVGIDRIGRWKPYTLYEVCILMNEKQLAGKE